LLSLFLAEDNFKMVFHVLNIGIFLFNLLIILVDIFSSRISFYNKLLCFSLVLPVLLVGIPLARLLFKWIQRWYYFLVRPLPYYLSSEFEKWQVFQLGPSVLALVAAGIFSLLVSFRICNYFIPIEKHNTESIPASNATKKLFSNNRPAVIPSGYQLGVVNSPYSEVTVRREPWDLATSPGKILKNSYLFVQDFGGPWIRIKDPYSDVEGFLPREQLTIFNNKEFPKLIEGDYQKSIIAHPYQSLRVMDRPAAQSSLVCEVRLDEVIYVKNAETDWLHVKRPRTGQEGFAEKKLILFLK